MWLTIFAVWLELKGDFVNFTKAFFTMADDFGGMRRTWMDIDLDHLSDNLSSIHSRVGEDKLICLPVKANAYGHGIVEISKKAEKCGVDFLAVACTDEGIKLRNEGIETRILLLGISLPDQVDVIIEHNLTPAVADIKFVGELNKEAEKKGKHVPVHVKVDTGMGRIGMPADSVVSFLEQLRSYSNIIVEGIFTHFPVSDEDIEFSSKELQNFKELINNLEDKNLRPKIVHAANSGAVVNLKNSYFDMVRPGIISYGYWSDESAKEKLNLKPVASLKSTVLYLKTIKKGDSVSYGRTFIAKKPTVVATIPIGYGDGLIRQFSNNLEVLIHGVRVPLIGRVTMDQAMLDVTKLFNTNDCGVKVGDTVTIIGKDGNDEITVEELADRVNTIPYEIVTLISARVSRFYHNE